MRGQVAAVALDRGGIAPGNRAGQGVGNPHSFDVVQGAADQRRQDRERLTAVQAAGRQHLDSRPHQGDQVVGGGHGRGMVEGLGSGGQPDEQGFEPVGQIFGQNDGRGIAFAGHENALERAAIEDRSRKALQRVQRTDMHPALAQHAQDFGIQRPAAVQGHRPGCQRAGRGQLTPDRPDPGVGCRDQHQIHRRPGIPRQIQPPAAPSRFHGGLYRYAAKAGKSHRHPTQGGQVPGPGKADPPAADDRIPQVKAVILPVCCHHR